MTRLGELTKDKKLEVAIERVRIFARRPAAGCPVSNPDFYLEYGPLRCCAPNLNSCQNFPAVFRSVSLFLGFTRSHIFGRKTAPIMSIFGLRVFRGIPFSLYARFENSVAILTFGCRWPRRRPRFHSKEKNLTFLSLNLSTVAPHLLKPFLNLQTSHFVKVLHVIRLREFWNDGKWFSHASCFFRVFLSRGRKTTKIDCKSLNFVSMYWPRS